MCIYIYAERDRERERERFVALNDREAPGTGYPLQHVPGQGSWSHRSVLEREREREREKEREPAGVMTRHSTQLSGAVLHAMPLVRASPARIDSMVLRRYNFDSRERGRLQG